MIPIDKATIDQKLDQIFLVKQPAKQVGSGDKEDQVYLVPVIEAPLVVSSGDQDADRENDFNVARQAMHDLVVQGKDLSQNALHFAKERQDPRSVQAAAMAQQTTRETVLALMDIHRTRKELAKIAVREGGDVYNQQIVLNGTTSELLKMMREIPHISETEAVKPDIVENTPYKQIKQGKLHDSNTTS